MAWNKPSPKASFAWLGQSSHTVRWQPEGELTSRTPSAASRINRIQPQAPDPFRVPQNTFSFRLSSEFPFFIASGNNAVVTSGFTQGTF